MLTRLDRPKQVRYPRFITTVLSLSAAASTMSPSTHAQGSSTKTPPISYSVQHGTVNVILAQGSNLVAVTDSMLTQGTEHDPSGIKLFKLNDKVICTMAGLYRSPGAMQSATLEAAIPQIIARFTNRVQSKYPIQILAEALEHTVTHELTYNIQALVAADASFNLSDPNLTVELTVAGFDSDGSIKIIPLTLTPFLNRYGVVYVSRPRPSGVDAPTCQFTGLTQTIPVNPGRPDAYALTVRQVSQSLSCEIVGL